MDIKADLSAPLWPPPSSASLTTAALSLEPIPVTALGFMLLIGHRIKSHSSLTTFTLAGCGLFLTASVTFSISLGQPATVKVAANVVRLLLSYNNKNMLETGLIIGGWDKYEGGKIYGIPLSGAAFRYWSYLYGFFDQAWKEGMTKDEAEQLVVKAVSLAIARDGASGGVVRTVIIDSEWVTRNFCPGDKLPLWHEELEPQNSLLDIRNAGGPEPMNI